MSRALAGLVVLAALAGCADGGERLVVSAASSLQPALRAYAEPFDARVSFAGSDELAAQIRRGVRPDVFASADTALPAALHAEGLVDEPVVFATNALVLAVAPGARIASAGDLGRPGVRLAIGSPTVPVGRYADAVLAQLGPRAAAAVRTREPSVAGIVAKLRAGAADAGLVYRTDVTAAAGELRSVALPGDIGAPRIAYAAAVVRGSERPEQARRFVAGLAASRDLRRAGFGAP